MSEGSTFLIGGARCGKSHLAQRLAESYELPTTIVVTAEAGDDEMVERIDRHRAERPAGWATVEAPRDLVATVASVPADRVLLLDCITFWVANRVMADDLDAHIEEEAATLADIFAARTAPVVVVSNEVGHGLVPADAMSRRFRDVHGRVNRTIADGADATYLVVAGQLLPLTRPTF